MGKTTKDSYLLELTETKKECLGIFLISLLSHSMVGLFWDWYDMWIQATVVYKP